MPKLTPTSKRAIVTASKRLSAADPVLGSVIESVGIAGLRDMRADRPPDHYGALVRAIVGQQLSVKVASTIHGRLTDRYGGRAPTPQEILDDDPDELRAVGLSRAKASYLHSLAEHVTTGELELEKLDFLADDEVIAELVAVKGLGLWTAHMFLIFHLRRPDILPTGDLGIKKAVQIAYALDNLPDPKALEARAQPWHPHRTLACRYLWRSLETEPIK